MEFEVVFVCCLLAVWLHLVKSQFEITKVPGIYLEWPVTRRPPSENNLPAKPNNYEKIVTSPSEIISGVKPDYRYVETNTTGKLLSSPGCPKSLLGIPWLYYKSRQGIRCYLTGSHGPCKTSQVFTPELGTQYGYCNCMCDEGVTGLSPYKYQRIQFCTGKKHMIYGFTNVIYVFVPREKDCFELYSQAFCDKGYWLVKEGENGLKCEPRQCPPDQIPDLKRNQQCILNPFFDYPPNHQSSLYGVSVNPCRHLKNATNYFGTCVFKVKYTFD